MYKKKTKVIRDIVEELGKRLRGINTKIIEFIYQFFDTKKIKRKQEKPFIFYYSCG